MNKPDYVCPNCGASMSNKDYALVCNYCGTVIFDYATISLDEAPFFARVKMPDGSTAVMKLCCCGGSITFEREQDCHIEMDFYAVPFESIYKKNTLLIKR